MNNFKGAIKRMLHKAASFEPMLKRWRSVKLRNKIIVLMYHELAEDEDEIEAWTVVKRSDFVRQMKYLTDNFRIVSLKDAFERMENSSSSEKPIAVITFDDGYAGNKNILLPIIKSMNIPVTIFVATQAVEDQTPYWYDRLLRVLQGKDIININLKHVSLDQYCINRVRGANNWAEIERLLKDLKTLQPAKRKDVVRDILGGLQTSSRVESRMMAPLTATGIRELADCALVTIGAHSHDHSILTQLTKDGIRESIETSKSLLESWLNRRVDYFSYPNGNYSDMVIEALKETGFECGLTTLSRPWNKEDSCFTIPRMGIGRYDSIEQFKIMVSD